MRPSGRMVTAILAMLVAIEIVSLIEQSLAPDLAIGDFGLQALPRAVFQFLAPFSPLLIVLILYSWVGRIIERLTSKYGVIRILSSRFSFISRLFKWLQVSWDGGRAPLLGSPLVALAVGMVSSCVLAFMPYRPDVNPAGIPVGADTAAYILWVNQMRQRPIPDALAYAFRQASNGDRPFSLMLPYTISGILGVTGDASVKFYPLLLAPLLVLSSFLFVFLGQGDKHTAGLVGLTTAFSFQFTVGMWAGYYANWLALAESFLFLGILLRWINSRSKTSFTGFVSLSIALLFTHPWTWDLMLLLSISFISAHILAHRDLKLMKVLTLFVAISLGADSFKSYVIGGYGGSRAGVDIAATSLGLSQLVAFWPNVVETFVQYYSMLLADAVALGLAVIAIWRISASHQDFTRLVVFWVVLASLPFPFLGSVLQSRIIYLLPVPVLASGAILGLQRLGLGRTQQSLIILLILLFGANHAMNSMFQLALGG